MKTIPILLAVTLACAAQAQSPYCEARSEAGCSDTTCAAAVCALDPFCCSTAWDARCASEASVACTACRPPSGCTPPTVQLADAEPCGTSGDDPCSMSPGAPRVVPLDTVVGGSLWSTESLRDVDWFAVTLTSPARLRVELWTAGPIGVAVLDDACPPTVHAESPDGCPVTCEACLPAGAWRVAVRPLLFEQLPCGDPRGSYAIRLHAEPCTPLAPANDRCDAALVASLGVVPFDCTHASTEPAWLPPMCDEGSGLALTHDVWFAFTAPEAAQYEFSTCGLADFDARIALYDQCGGAVLACSDDACADGGASMSAGLVCGQTVLLRVGGWGHGAGGALRIVPSLAAGCECPGDLDGNGEIDGSDAAVLLLCFGDAGGPADIDGDGEVGSADLGLLLLLNGPCG